VYELVAKRSLAALLPAYDMAKQSLSTAEGNERLALHEAIVDSLGNLLRELGEHGLQNLRLHGIESSEIDVRKWVDECAASLQEVQRMRESGVTSAPLIERYMAGRLMPIGSVEWLNRNQLGASNRDDAWVAKLVKRLKRK
jgi:hypothetical protein